MDFNYDSEEEDDFDFSMPMPDFGIDQAILDYHGINVGDEVNYSYDVNEDGFELTIGSKSRKLDEQNVPINYTMPSAFIDYFCGDMYTSNALATLSKAINTPYESCISEPLAKELTPEEKTVTLAETKIAEVLAPMCTYIVNPTKSAVSRFDRINSDIIVVFTCKEEEFNSSSENSTIINIIPRKRMIFCLWEELQSIISDGKSYFGYNYIGMINGKYKGYALKVNLANSLVYGLNVLDYETKYRAFDPNKIDQEWGVAVPKKFMAEPCRDLEPKLIPSYFMTVRRKHDLKTTDWCDPMLPYLAYDLITLLPPKMSSAKNYKLNCFSVVSSEHMNLAAGQIDYPMYSPVGFGYPQTYVQDLIWFHYGPMKGVSNFVGRFCDVGGELKLVDVVYPALAWETRVDIVHRYGHFFRKSDKNWVKVNPRVTATQVYFQNNDSSIVLRGKRIRRDDKEGDIVASQGSFKFDPAGDLFLVHSAVGTPLVSDPSVKVLIMHDTNAFVNKKLSTLAFEHVGHIKFLGDDDLIMKQTYYVARKFFASSHYVPGRQILTGSYSEDAFVRPNVDGTWSVLNFVPPEIGDSTLLAIPPGLSTHRFTPYNKYDMEFGGVITV